MSATHTVVRKIDPLGEDDFHAAFMVLLSRMVKQHGQENVAYALGYSSKRQLANLASGSLPSLRAFYNLLTLDECAHDELDAEYGLRKVDKDAMCSSDPLTRDMIALAHETAEDEAPDSDGGRVVTDQELLAKDEARLRRVYRTLGTWLHRIETIRKPRRLRAA